MLRPNRKYLIVGLVAVATIAFIAPQAQAFRGHGWGGSCYNSCYSYSSCYAPCYTPCYSSCYTPCYSSCYSSCDPCGSGYLGYRRGPIRRALFGPYKWYNSGYYGGCYSACGGCGTCGDCCSWDTCGSICTPTGCGDDCQPSAAPMEASPSQDTPTVAPPNAAPKLPASTQINTRDNSGILTIWVPSKAKVFINGMETTTTGSHRRYVSNGLQPGLTYKYVIRAEIVRNGKIAAESKTVNLTAGSDEGVAFGFNVGLNQQFAAAQQ